MAQLIGFTASTQIFDPRTGQFTGEGFRLIQFIVQSVNGDAAVVTTDGAQTLTNKTIDGDNNTLTDIATASLKTKTGVIGRVVTGAAGGSGNLAQWNADGDLVDGAIAITDLLTTADIGVTVQPFDATILTEADIGVTVQPYNAGALDGSDIGVLVQAYDPELTVWAGKSAPTGAVVGTTDIQTLEGKTFSDIPLLSGGGIKFPTIDIPSADPNTLDDYDEGVWAPAISFGGAAVGLTYSFQDGRYRKIGDTVFVWGRIILTAKGSSVGSVLVSGLPFTAVTSALAGAVIIQRAAGMLLLTSALDGYVNAGASTLQISMTNSGGSVFLSDANFSNTSDVMFMAVYNV